MLHASQDVPCHERVRHWNSAAGQADFVRLVGTFVQPPPHPDDAEALRTLAAAVPPRLVPASAADVESRVVDAARDAAHRLRMARESAARFHDFCHTPVPPRHSVYVGPGDRRAEADGSELALPTRHNPHFQRWLRAE